MEYSNKLTRSQMYKILRALKQDESVQFRIWIIARKEAGWNIVHCDGKSFLYAGTMRTSVTPHLSFAIDFLQRDQNY